MEIILASASPRRKELMEVLGIPFSVCVSDADESTDENLPPYFIVEQLSLLKASDVAGKMRKAGKEALVIGADTIVVADDVILTKPKDKEDAKNMLLSLSGKWHSVLSGVTVMNTKTAKSETFYVETKVHFLALTEEEIDAYIATNEPMDKAGSYGIQGKGSVFIDKIEGDYFNVVGLPICRLARVLKEEFQVNVM